MPIEQTTRKTFRFVGLRFDDLTLSEAVGSLRQSVATRRRQMVCSPNASLVVLANEDPQIRSIYNAAQMVTVDSHVVFYSAKLFGKPVREPVSTARLMLNMLPVCGAEKYRVYLLGAQEDVVRTVAERLPVDYPGIEVVGWRNGYFDFNDDSKVVQAIADARPDVLFVAMSSPMKETFIAKNMVRMDVPVCMGVGGTFDIIAGKCKLAPEWISKIGLEWLYRWAQEPRRLARRYVVTNSKFLWLLLKEVLAGEKGRHERTA